MSRLTFLWKETGVEDAQNHLVHMFCSSMVFDLPNARSMASMTATTNVAQNPQVRGSNKVCGVDVLPSLGCHQHRDRNDHHH